MPLKYNNKKILVLLGILVLILVLLVVAIFLLKGQENKKVTLTPEQQAQLQEVFNATEDDLTMETKKIKLEIATDEELAEMGLITDTPEGKVRIQVIERDENGKIISYKVIYKDEDIATEISVPKRGYFTEGGVVPFLEE